MKQFLYFAISICAFAIPLLFLLVYRWHQSRKNKRAPFTDKFLRSPGQSLNDQIQSLSEDITINSIYVMILPLFMLSPAFIFSIDLIYFIVIIVVFELFFFKKLWKSLNERRHLRLGYDGEIAVGQELNLLMLDGYHVYHDFLTHKFNIDHIFVGSSGVYAVETKARSKSSIKKGTKEATVIYDGTCLKFPHYSDTSSLKQARINAIWLQKWLTGAVGESEAILTLPGW